MPLDTSTRPITDEDLPFLAKLYGSTREEEMAIVPWSDLEKKEFLTMQFFAQHKHYMEYYAGSAFDIIEQNGEPIGRLYLDRRKDEYRIVDIALLPEFRGMGIGSKYLWSIMNEAGRKNLPVRIHVEANNPAMGLYLRLGYVHIDTNGVYHLMEWKPNS